MSARRYELAAELADAAELLVRAAEAALDAARDPTMRDVAETELHRPCSSRMRSWRTWRRRSRERERQIRADMRAAVASLRDEPGSDWMSQASALDERRGQVEAGPAGRSTHLREGFPIQTSGADPRARREPSA